jgi:hypothetical protein
MLQIECRPAPSEVDRLKCLLEQMLRCDRILRESKEMCDGD